MAYHRKQAQAQQGPALVVMALILFTATADAQIGGRLCCTPNGNCLLGSPGVPVGLNCTDLAGVSVQVGQGTTNVNGNFNITVPDVGQTLGNVLTLNPPAPCTVGIQLPISHTLCPALSTVQGVLIGVIPAVLTCVNPITVLQLGDNTVSQYTLSATVGV